MSHFIQVRDMCCGDCNYALAFMELFVPNRNCLELIFLVLVAVNGLASALLVTSDDPDHLVCQEHAGITAGSYNGLKRSPLASDNLFKLADGGGDSGKNMAPTVAPPAPKQVPFHKYVNEARPPNIIPRNSNRSRSMYMYRKKLRPIREVGDMEKRLRSLNPRSIAIFQKSDLKSIKNGFIGSGGTGSLHLKYLVPLSTIVVAKVIHKNVIRKTIAEFGATRKNPYVLQTRDPFIEVKILSGLPPHPNIIKLIGIGIPASKSKSSADSSTDSDGISLDKVSHALKLADMLILYERLFMDLDTILSIYGKLYSNIKDRAHLSLFSPKIVREIMRQLLSALEHLEANHIVHRDISPSNLMIDKRGGNIKVIDFGFAIDLSKPGTECCNAIRGPFNGIYDAPEVLLHGPATAKSDMWSAGLVFLKLSMTENLLPWEETNMVPVMELLTHSMKHHYSLTKSIGPLTQYLDHIKMRMKKTSLPGAFDLFLFMTSWIPHERCTPKQALQHPYFNE